ncbi:protein CapI, partial [Vibrio sp.]|nr:protein CapI [Vibrio sp.]
RDFTYIDDIVEGVIRIQDVIPSADPDWNVEEGSPATSSAPYRVYNIGHGSPVKLLDFVDALEKSLGITAKKNFLPMQPGDVYMTFADTTDLYSVIGYKPQVDVATGVKAFTDWFKSYYQY